MTAETPFAYAKAFARRGIRVFPLHGLRADGGCTCDDGGACKNVAKHPRIRDWQKLATLEPVQIARWFDKSPAPNLGLVTGAASGIVVLDVDPRHHGHLALEALEAVHGELPATWRFRTGGGGWHVVFAYPDHARVPNSANKLGQGLDTRGDGGYIVAPPSIHASGRRYEVDPDHAPGEVELAPLPQWIIDTLAPAAGQPGERTPAGEWKWVWQGVREGGRNVHMAKLAGHLLRGDVNPHVALTLCRTWNTLKCTPPLDDEELTRTVDSVARSERNRRQGRR